MDSGSADRRFDPCVSPWTADQSLLSILLSRARVLRVCQFELNSGRQLSQARLPARAPDRGQAVRCRLQHYLIVSHYVGLSFCQVEFRSGRADLTAGGVHYSCASRFQCSLEEAAKRWVSTPLSLRRPQVTVSYTCKCTSRVSKASVSR